MFRRKAKPEPADRPAGITDAELGAEAARLEAAARALEDRLQEVDGAVLRAAQNRDGAGVDRLGRLAELEAARAEQARRAELRRREWEAQFEAWAGPWREREAAEKGRIRREAIRRLSLPVRGRA